MPRPSLSENLAHEGSTADAGHSAPRSRRANFSSEAEWSDSRLLSGLRGESMPPAGALARADEPYSHLPPNQINRNRMMMNSPGSEESLELATLCAAASPHALTRVRTCPCFSMVEHPPRTRCDPVRLRAWAPIIEFNCSTRKPCRLDPYRIRTRNACAYAHHDQQNTMSPTFAPLRLDRTTYHSPPTQLESRASGLYPGASPRRLTRTVSLLV